MANINLYRGGTPVVKFMWNKTDRQQFLPPFSTDHVGSKNKLFADELPMLETPPYDSHADGAYNVGNFVIGAQLNPNGRGNVAQRKALTYETIAVGDVLQLIWLPEDHMATYLNLKSINADSNMAGATISLICQNATVDANGDWTYTEDTDFAAAVTAQAGSNTFDVSEPFNAMVSLFKVSGDYAVPMYGTPYLPAGTSSAVQYPIFKIFGLKIASLPTDTNLSLADMHKSIYMSLRMEAFECPSA